MKTHAYLDFADLVLQLKRRDLYDDALAELAERRADEPFPIQQYRSGVATAMLSESLGRMADAREAAIRAITAAGITKSPFSYHRQLGLVSEIDEDVQSRLWRLAGQAP